MVTTMTMIASELLLAVHLALLLLGPAAGVDLGPPDAEPVAGLGLRGPPFLLTAPPPPQWESTTGFEWGTTEAEDGSTAATPEMAQEDGQETQRAEDENAVRFLLYTKAHPSQAQQLRNLSLRGTDFDPSLQSFFVVHGFTGDASADSVVLIRDALLRPGGPACNVVAVEWRGLAAGPHYARAANNTRVAAARLAALLTALADQGVHGNSTHLIGFSLGAQVAGRAGALLGRRSEAFPSRLTALDPARPAFEAAGPGERVGRSSAGFVAALHTAGGVVAFDAPLGHVDFFPNGGRSPQPPCAGGAVHVVCSHLLAPRYLAEAIRRPGAFRAVLCSSWRDFQAGLCAGAQPALFGISTDDSLRGSFFLRTNAEEPYGRGDSGDEIATTTDHRLTEDGDDNSLHDDEHNNGNKCRANATPALARALAATLALLAAAR